MKKRIFTYSFLGVLLGLAGCATSDYDKLDAMVAVNGECISKEIVVFDAQVARSVDRSFNKFYSPDILNNDFFMNNGVEGESAVPDLRKLFSTKAIKGTARSVQSGEIPLMRGVVLWSEQYKSEPLFSVLPDSSAAKDIKQIAGHFPANAVAVAYSCGSVGKLLKNLQINVAFNNMWQDLQNMADTEGVDLNALTNLPDNSEFFMYAVVNGMVDDGSIEFKVHYDLPISLSAVKGALENNFTAADNGMWLAENGEVVCYEANGRLQIELLSQPGAKFTDSKKTLADNEEFLRYMAVLPIEKANSLSYFNLKNNVSADYAEAAESLIILDAAQVRENGLYTFAATKLPSLYACGMEQVVGSLVLNLSGEVEQIIAMQSMLAENVDFNDEDDMADEDDESVELEEDVE